MSMEILKGPFGPTLDSLRNFKCPEWYRDAKMGFWSHWGPQSVTLAGDWYARNMYIEGSPQYIYHWRKYGHPSKFGYKDIVPLWKAESFDPDALMSLYYEAGARFFMSQAVHHDNFDNWNSKHNAWNATKVGPHKDIVGMWHEAANKHGMRFGLSEHLGASLNWFSVNKDCDEEGPYAGVPYDGNDPAYEDFYHPARELANKTDGEGYFSHNPWWHQRWFDRIKDVIDQHEPDFLYSDQDVFDGDSVWRIIAHLYNLSVKKHGGANEAFYSQKSEDPGVKGIGVLDIERGTIQGISPDPWQTDTCLGGWFYNANVVYKKTDEIIAMLVDTVSKNGNLMLNIPQRADGTLDDECMYTVKGMAKWMKVNGEGIYATRPWKVYGEGPTSPVAGKMAEKTATWTGDDFRFTAKGNAVYAFQMGASDSRILMIKSLSHKAASPVQTVELLGCQCMPQHLQTDECLSITIPEGLPQEKLKCFRIQLA